MYSGSIPHRSNKMSPLAIKLWKLLTERPGRYTMQEASIDLKASKSAITRALGELEEERLLSIEEEDV